MPRPSTNESAILAVNAGSSSLKLALFSVSDSGDPQRFATRRFDASGAAVGAASALEEWIDGHLDGRRLLAAGHRVVHGGTHFFAPVVVDDRVLTTLESLVPLAPLHQPGCLTTISLLRRRRPDLAQVACFDTAFHHGRGILFERYALPDAYYRRGIRRYGFHGISCEYLMHELGRVDPRLARGRTILAHLGAGASMTAVDHGRSVDTTMGFSALDGLPMGTRSGSLDPGVLLYLLHAEGMDRERLERLLYRESGLLGISGITADVRTLLDSDESKAHEAIEYFVLRACREVGALAASLGGVDGLVFTGGVGQNSAEIRARICRASHWLGIELDEEANLGGEPVITTERSKVRVRVVPADGERMIAIHAASVVAAR